MDTKKHRETGPCDSRRLYIKSQGLRSPVLEVISINYFLSD